ncbi:hypothetical protein FRC07_004369 [Ceratobasidium sp. 392]|nr:hypothetical protein FRC07_004369 [Ceratobasidium sp. 392]
MELSINVGNIEDVFPAVRHFYGPWRIACPLTSSGIAEQLETLVLGGTYISRRGRPLGSPTPYPKPLMLPRLRKLYVIASVDIQSLVEFTPNLEKIRMFYSLEIYNKNSAASNELMDILHHVPKLRELELLSLSNPNKITASSVMQVMRQVTLLCPKLSRVEHRSGGCKLLGYWEIYHDHEGKATLQYYFNPRSTIFSGLEFAMTEITSGLGSHPWCRFDGWYGSLDSD